MTNNEELWCDGGVILVNPSPNGGTWAWVFLRNGQRAQHGSGLILPELFGIPKITNNLSELYAAVRALEFAGAGWPGTLWTDSLITLRRLTTSSRFRGIPQWLRLRVLDLRRGRKYDVQLCGGHPTKKDLRHGMLARNGLPCSQWNDWCDRECTRLAGEFLCKKSRELV